MTNKRYERSILCAIYKQYVCTAHAVHPIHVHYTCSTGTNHEQQYMCITHAIHAHGACSADNVGAVPRDSPSTAVGQRVILKCK